jgi:hypothetical protein
MALVTSDAPSAECRFFDLCLDAVDDHGVAAVWAALLGRGLEPIDGGGWRTVPPETASAAAADSDADAVGLCVLPVPEAGDGSTRVRLDVQLATHDVNAPLMAGARLLSTPQDGGSWWVLADPEGNRLHAMPPPPPELHIPPVEATTPFELVVEAADPQAQARWWADRTGGRARNRPGATFWWVDGAAGFPLMFWMFVAQTAPKSAKNRVHWDVVLRDDSPQALLDAGATVLRAPDGEIDWWVLADPEGNEFCAFLPQA